jgi:hypothetical protein
MTKPKHPCLKKGYRFSIDWPPGFVAQPYEPPHPMSNEGNPTKRPTGGRDMLNKLTGRKYYSKKSTHDFIQRRK